MARCEIQRDNCLGEGQEEKTMKTKCAFWQASESVAARPENGCWRCGLVTHAKLHAQRLDGFLPGCRHGWRLGSQPFQKHAARTGTDCPPATDRNLRLYRRGRRNHR